MPERILFEWDEALRSGAIAGNTGSPSSKPHRYSCDPLQFSSRDRVEDGEQRGQTFGLTHRFIVLLVAHTSMEYDEDGEEVEVIRIISHTACRQTRKALLLKKKMVRYTHETLPPLTEKQRASLAALAARPDSEIDYSDIPPLPDDVMKDAVRGRFYRPIKRQVTVRIDQDVLEWLKSFGKGYQSRINAILRREMLASSK